MLTTVTTIALGALVVAAALCLRRLVVGKSLADRMVALDALLLISVSGIAVLAVRSSSGIFLDALVVAALIAFVGTITVARFITWRGAS